jgi:hypothetical protein
MFLIGLNPRCKFILIVIVGSELCTGKCKLEALHRPSVGNLTRPPLHLLAAFYYDIDYEDEEPVIAGE